MNATFESASQRIFGVAQSLFPHFFASVSEEDSKTLLKIIGEFLYLAPIWLFPNKRVHAEIAMSQNYNTLEWMVLSRLRDEQKENMERVFKLIKESAVIGGGAIITILPLLAAKEPTDGR